MVIEGIAVRDFLSVAVAVEKKFLPMIYETCPMNGDKEQAAGKAPWFTGLRTFVGERRVPISGFCKTAISGEVKLCGHWVWLGKMMEGRRQLLYVAVPSLVSDTFEAGGSMKTGGVYFDPDDAIDTVRQKIIEGREKICVIAAECGLVAGEGSDGIRPLEGRLNSILKFGEE